MDFYTLYEKISPRLKKIAYNRSGNAFSASYDDLYQEMCIHLWNNFKNGVPEGVNEAYILQGCKFHMLNYIRKEKENIEKLSLEEPINNEGETLKDIIPLELEPMDRQAERNITFETIKNNGYSKREKEVLAFLLSGYTTREIGKNLGISHVMVVKYKKRIIIKWHSKNKGYQE